MLSLKKFTDANTGIDVFINPAVVSHVAAYRRWSSRDEAFILDGTLIHLTEFEQRVHVKEPVGYVVALLQAGTRAICVECYQVLDNSYGTRCPDCTRMVARTAAGVCAVCGGSTEHNLEVHIRAESATDGVTA